MEESLFRLNITYIMFRRSPHQTDE